MFFFGIGTNKILESDGREILQNWPLIYDDDDDYDRYSLFSVGGREGEREKIYN